VRTPHHVVPSPVRLATWSEQPETEGGGITGLTASEEYGTEEHGRPHTRRDFEPNPIHAVVVHQWQGRDYGAGGTTVFLTNASVTQPLQPFDDDDDRSLLGNCCIKEAKQRWELGHPPQQTEQAVRVHALFILLICVPATAYRR